MSCIRSLAIEQAARRLHVASATPGLEAAERWPDWETYDRIAATFGWPRSFVGKP